MYLFCQSQIRVAPSGDIIGLDYNAVLNVMDLYGVKNLQMFEKVLECHRLAHEFSNS